MLNESHFKIARLNNVECLRLNHEWPALQGIPSIPSRSYQGRRRGNRESLGGSKSLMRINITLAPHDQRERHPTF